MVKLVQNIGGVVEIIGPSLVCLANERTHGCREPKGRRDEVQVRSHRDWNMVRSGDASGLQLVLSVLIVHVGSVQQSLSLCVDIIPIMRTTTGRNHHCRSDYLRHRDGGRDEIAVRRVLAF